jgi:putative copper export protein
MGYAAVALLAATGAINTLLLVGNVDSLAGTPCGRLLSLKILLFSVMVVLALINRFRLLRRLRREPPSSAPIAALARSVLFEQRGVRKGRPGVRCARRGDHERHARAQLHVLGG